MIGESLARRLPRMQAQAESRMLDTCTVQRVTGVTTDPLTGLDTPTYSPVYSGLCEFKTAAFVALSEESASSQVTVQTDTLKVPTTAPALLPGDLVTFSAATLTPRLRNLRARVDGVHVGTFTTAQRVPLIVLPGVA